MTRTATLLLTLLMASAAAGAPPSDVLSLGKVELTLGAPQDEVKAALLEHYVLEPTPAEPSFFVYEKGPGGPGRSLGAVEFQEGRLTSVTRELWPQGQADAPAFAKALADVLAKLASEGQTSCTLEAQSAPPVQAAMIRCGRKQVSIAIVDAPEPKVVLTEMLR